MFYPHRDDYKCPECKTGTMKWKGMEFHSTYVLGMSFCDNPDCVNHEDNWLKPFTRKTFEALLKKSAQPLQGQEPTPSPKSGETSESPTFGDCNERNTRSGRSGDI